jgi:hypothetical protein
MIKKSMLILFFLTFLNQSCGLKNKTSNNPQKTEVVLRPLSEDSGFLLYSTTNYQSGSIHALDLKSGVITKNLFPVGSDTKLVQDSHNPRNFFLLTRFQHDSIQWMHFDQNTNQNQKQLTLLREFPLPPFSNPQHVTRDDQGLIYVTFQERNDIWVLSPDLTKKVATLDLNDQKILSDGHDSLFELGFIEKKDEKTLMVLSQRLRRQFIPGTWDWIPHPQGAITFIHKALDGNGSLTYELESHPLEISNPFYLFCESSELESKNKKCFAFLSCDLYPHHETWVSMESFSYDITSFSQNPLTKAEGLILDGTYGPLNGRHTIHWNPTLATLCLKNKTQDLHCEKSQTSREMEKITTSPRLIFISSYVMGSGFIRVFNLNGMELQRTPQEESISSMIYIQ